MATAQAIRPQLAVSQQQKEFASVFTNTTITGTLISQQLTVFRTTITAVCEEAAGCRG